MARRRRESEPTREPSRLDDDRYAAALYRRLAAPGYGLRVAGFEGSALDRVAAHRLRQVIALVEAGERVPAHALVPGWRDVLVAEGLADG